MGPSFLGIGAQKCGTSWLYRNLAAHPEVWLPPEKELHFFDERLYSDRSLASRVLGTSEESRRWRRQVRRQIKRFRRGHADRSQLGWYARYFLGTADRDWYAALFRPADQRVSGDITPDYSVLTDDQIATARDLLDADVQLIFLVRNPLERIWSHAKMEERLLDVTAVEAVEDLLDRPRARQLTDYLATLDRWTACFPPERIFLGFMEDIGLQPSRLLDEVCDFLGVGRLDAYRAAERVVHEGGHDTIPTPTAIRLAEELIDEIRELERRLGGYAGWWRAAAERLVADPPGATELRYPLWDDELWEDWVAAAPDGAAVGETVASSPLSRRSSFAAR